MLMCEILRKSKIWHSKSCLIKTNCFMNDNIRVYIVVLNWSWICNMWQFWQDILTTRKSNATGLCSLLSSGFLSQQGTNSLSRTFTFSVPLWWKSFQPPADLLWPLETLRNSSWHAAPITIKKKKCTCPSLAYYSNLACSGSTLLLALLMVLINFL